MLGGTRGEAVLAIVGLAAVAFAPALPQAGAFHVEGTQPVESQGFQDPAWVSFLVDVDQGQAVLDGAIHGPGSHTAFGWGIYEADTNATLSSSTVLGYSTPSGAYVQAKSGKGPSVHERQTERHPGGGGRTLRWGTQVDEPGTYRFVVWTAGHLGSWEWSVQQKAKEGETAQVSVRELRQGSQTFFHTSRNFTGTANVQFYGLGVGVRAQYETSKAVTVEDTLLGWYTKSGSPGHPNQANELNVTLPNGTRAECPCTFEDVRGDRRYGPGEYVFHHTGAGASAGILPPPEILLAGADVELP